MQDMDYMPDIFYFNFMGYSGRFVIDNQGVPTIISGDYVNVDISGLNEVYESFGEYDSYIPVNANQYPDNSSVISITTNDGYKYTFGGDIEALEYAVLYDTVQIVPPISTWHLTSIKAPNGRTMTLQYKQTPQNQMKFLTRDYDWNEEYLVLSTNTHIMHSLQKRCILESIITSGDAPITISFFSSSEQHKMYEHPTLSYCQQNLQLDSIIVMSGERKFASARMAYMYKSSNSLLSTVNSFWHYLQSVNISGAGTYSFSYNSLNTNLPIAPTSNYIYPDIFVTTDNGYKSLVDRFGFWKASSKQGLLSKVFLPTGGQIRFTYDSIRPIRGMWNYILSHTQPIKRLVAHV